MYIETGIPFPANSSLWKIQSMLETNASFLECDNSPYPATPRLGASKCNNLDPDLLYVREAICFLQEQEYI